MLSSDNQRWNSLHALLASLPVRRTCGGNLDALRSHLSEQAGFEVSPDSIGLLGAVIVDMQASFLPSERVEKGPFVAYERPRDVAYISNLAVLPRARRQGVGEQLLLAAEKVGCYTNVLSDLRSMVLSTLCR